MGLEAEVTSKVFFDFAIDAQPAGLNPIPKILNLRLLTPNPKP